MNWKYLRQRDSSGNAKSSWRITVRQLESMLRCLMHHIIVKLYWKISRFWRIRYTQFHSSRLSEAFARLHCCEEVTARHVKEAYRLLNKSIIRWTRFLGRSLIFSFASLQWHCTSLRNSLRLELWLKFSFAQSWPARCRSGRRWCPCRRGRGSWGGHGHQRAAGDRQEAVQAELREVQEDQLPHHRAHQVGTWDKFQCLIFMGLRSANFW